MNYDRLNVSLYEKLTGYFSDGISVDRCDENMRLVLSVRDTIYAILNSRQGALKHLPDYGLPDLSVIYHHLPASAQSLKRHISYTLLRYEPRLKTIHVEQKRAEADVLLSYELNCCLWQGEQVCFDSHFLSGGRIRLIGYYKKYLQ